MVGALTPLGFAELALAIIAIASSVLTGYALAAARARLLLTSPRNVRLMNRGSAVVMAGAARHHRGALSGARGSGRHRPALVGSQPGVGAAGGQQGRGGCRLR